MTCSAIYAQELRSRGFRMTPQRMAILHALHHSGSHLSPVQVYERAHADLPGLTEVTVYRSLEFLAENDVVLPALNGDGHLVYEIAGRDHHHLICRSCGRSVEVEHALLQKLYEQLETKSGYQLTTSHLTFFGLCPECQTNSQ